MCIYMYDLSSVAETYRSRAQEGGLIASFSMGSFPWVDCQYSLLEPLNQVTV